MENYSNIVKENDITAFVISNKDYADSVMKVAKAAADTQKKVCYVSMNKPHDVIAKDFAKSGIDGKKFFFIDCTGKVSGSDGVIYVSSPRALTEISLAISKVADEAGATATLFDSLSTLLIYDNPTNVIKFAHAIISTFRSKKTKALFICLKDSMKPELVGDLSMFTDKIIEL